MQMVDGTEAKIIIAKGINEALINLIAGRQERTYNILRDLEDELIADIRNSQDTKERELVNQR